MKAVSKGPSESDQKKKGGQDMIIEKAAVSDAEELLTPPEKLTVFVKLW
jgi:hypothetical protein